MTGNYYLDLTIGIIIVVALCAVLVALDRRRGER